MKAGTTVSKAHASGPERVTKSSKSRGQAKGSSGLVSTKTHSPDLLLTLDDFETQPDLCLRHYPEFIYVFGCYPEFAKVLKADSSLVRLIDMRAILKTHLSERPHIRDEMFCDAVDDFVQELLNLSRSEREEALRIWGVHSKRFIELRLRGVRLAESSPVAAKLRPSTSILKMAGLAEANRRDSERYLEHQGLLPGDRWLRLACQNSIETAPRTRTR